MRAAEVLRIAEDICKVENEIRQNIRNGMRMAEVHVKHKYHHLQSPAYDEKG